MLCALSALGVQTSSPLPAAAPAGSASPSDDAVAQLVGRLDLERYKATIKGLTRFGDRRQGTDRNRAAVDWIESQLRATAARISPELRYQYSPERKGTPVARR